MKVLFEYGVDFISLPLSPPTIENCKKCAFYLYPKIPGGNCIRTDDGICGVGRNGYFVRNYMREAVDVMAYPAWKEAEDGRTETL
jgi:hypothetical protein